MPTYRVEAKEVIIKWFTVEAEDEDAAYNAASETYGDLPDNTDEKYHLDFTVEEERSEYGYIVKVRTPGDVRDWDDIPGQRYIDVSETQVVFICRKLAEEYQAEVRWNDAGSYQGHYITIGSEK